MNLGYIKLKAINLKSAINNQRNKELGGSIWEIIH